MMLVWKLLFGRELVFNVLNSLRLKCFPVLRFILRVEIELTSEEVSLVKWPGVGFSLENNFK